MALPSLFIFSLVALGTQWPIIDLPYPEVDPIEAAGPLVEVQVRDAVVRFERSRDSPRTAARLADISRIRIEGTRATARFSTADGFECVRLERVGDEWRVVGVSGSSAR